ncbi:hypothetical protein FRC08_006246 [Ceratobasidium sp. 394]|nr:hypothetical protein FRC08_006246 [Ceratobasidium sp. 394]KAG9099580.1 hypothetical protein FS749_000903 [Ceratobasidium sp. UAMH 11750]
MARTKQNNRKSTAAKADRQPIVLYQRQDDGTVIALTLSHAPDNASCESGGSNYLTPDNDTNKFVENSSTTAA